MLKEAEGGDVAACKLAYQRFEGWSEKRDIKADIGLDIGKEGKIELVFVDAQAPFANEEELPEPEKPLPIKFIEKPGDLIS